MSENPVLKEWYAIVNPKPGNGKGKRDWDRISGLFERENIPVFSQFTQNKGHAIEYTRKAINTDFRKIISVGGDGTLNEVVNGIFTQECCSSKDLTIGMIPV